MIKALFTLGLWACLVAFGQAQTLPTITSATYETVAPVGNSPKSATTVKASVPSIGGIAKVQVTVTDGSNNTLHTQTYDIARVAVPLKSGGYLLSLKFFTAASLAGATISVQLEDADETLGAPFSATAQ